jgi:hypothetical protein
LIEEGAVLLELISGKTVVILEVGEVSGRAFTKIVGVDIIRLEDVVLDTTALLDPHITLSNGRGAVMLVELVTSFVVGEILDFVDTRSLLLIASDGRQRFFELLLIFWGAAIQDSVQLIV